MESKSIDIHKSNMDEIDFIITELEIFKWTLDKKIIHNKPLYIELVFTRDSNMKQYNEVLDMEKEYNLLRDEEKKLYKKLKVLDKNDAHSASKGFIMIMYSLIALYFLLVLIVSIFLRAFPIQEKFFYLLCIIFIIYIGVKMYHFFYKIVEKQRERVNFQFKKINLKKKNIKIFLNQML